MGDLELYGLAASSVAVAAIIASVLRNRRTKRKRCVWVRSLFRRRQELGAANVLLPELRTHSFIENPVINPYSFKQYMKMNEAAYDLLFSIIESDITGCPSYRQPISAHEKFAATLRYLATGRLHGF